MKTATIESEGPEALDATERVAQPAGCGSDLDPDFPIEGTGGPSDGVSQPHMGTIPPPGP